uniref:Uncharacterized protein n=1 Tax=Arundo donax TaxID=35708 RepID=A0A0A9HTF5_ARUDO
MTKFVTTTYKYEQISPNQTRDDQHGTTNFHKLSRSTANIELM